MWTGEGRRSSTTTDAEGRFELTSLLAGDHVVEFRLDREIASLASEVPTKFFVSLEPGEIRELVIDVPVSRGAQVTLHGLLNQRDAAEATIHFDLDGDSILDLELDEEGLGTAMLPADQPLSVSLELADGPRRFVGVFQFVAGVSIETIQLDTMTLVIELDAPLADGYLCFEVEGDLDCIRGEPIDVGSHGPIVRFDHLPLAATDRVIRKFERDSPVRSLEAELEGLPTTPGMTRRLEWRSNSAGD